MTWQEIVQRYHIKYYDQISRVTKPLDCLDIVCVDYLRTYANGKFAYLTNRPEFTEYYASEQLYRIDPFFRHPDFYKDGFLWLENCNSSDFKNVVFLTNRQFHLHSPLLLIEKAKNYVEMFCFSGKSDEAIQALHLNHAHLLKTFREYYRRELHPLLNKMEEEGGSLIDLQGEFFFEGYPASEIKTETIHAFLIALGKKAEVEKASLLSPRERDCLRLLMRGNSAKDSAIELNLSPRTIEFYLENVKNKLDCSSRRELLLIASDFQNLGLL